MEFHETLQELRKQKGLTQEELAEALFVSRTAVSKWESGRGYPNIDSLKAIAKFFSVTIDQLLSGDEVLSLAEEDQKQKDAQVRSLVFGLLDCSTAVFLFLPLFGQKTGDFVQSVSLLSLTGIQPWLKTVYAAVIAAMVLSGLLTLALQNRCGEGEKDPSIRWSVLLNAAGVLLFIMSLQPYAAVFLLVDLAIKVFLLMKQR